jgi:hypothetical protein
MHVLLADMEGIAHGKNADLVALDEALNELAKFNKRLSKIVELLFFFGPEPGGDRRGVEYLAAPRAEGWHRRGSIVS